MPILADHIVVAIFAVAYPIYCLLSYPGFKKKIEQGIAGARSGGYRETLAWLWGLAICGFIVWVYSDRPLAVVGLGAPSGWRFWSGAGLMVVVFFVLMKQLRQLTEDEEERLKLRRQFEKVKGLMPQSDGEMRLFMALSVTAGICEEFLYRGYLIWYVAQFTGTVVGALVASVIFGLAHLYQGPAGALRVAMLGAVFAALYLFTESLWVPMLLHVMVDIYSGKSSRLAFQ